MDFLKWDKSSSLTIQSHRLIDFAQEVGSKVITKKNIAHRGVNARHMEFRIVTTRGATVFFRNDMESTAVYGAVLRIEEGSLPHSETTPDLYRA